MDDKIQAYFGRLTGRELALETPVTLTSAQTGAAHAWLTRNGVAFSPATLLSRNFSLDQLLRPESAPEDGSAPARAPQREAPRAEVKTAPFGPGIGIDVQAHAILPKPDDFREDPFYAQNFTEREIAHCLRRDDPRRAFAGLWAAKEAILKAAGRDAAGETNLLAIEIDHDAVGRPTHPGAQISISHGEDFSVAACILASTAAAPEREANAQPLPAISQPESETATPGTLWKVLSLAGLASGSTALALLVALLLQGG